MPSPTKRPVTSRPAKPAKLPYAKEIATYYATLKDFSTQMAFHEGAVSTAFQSLLATVARKPHNWTLIPQLTDKSKQIRPDGTLKDQMLVVRGHWEAKDTNDDLDKEIAKKIKAGYPTNNIIFEDTRAAVLIQHGNETMRVDLTNPSQLSDLLHTFFSYTEPQIETFEKAVDEFQTRVPDLAKALVKILDDAHANNKKFQTAFNAFHNLCKSALNPNLAVAAVDEMLVQHMLTERLIREIFGQTEFDRQNVIAAEIERVIDALAAQRSFNRRDFLKSLDRFYVAIENAARTMPEFEDKQHFLNTVYERFFQGYSVKLADTMGIVYTPQPIVDFMCASVAEVLEKEFGKPLGHKDVYLLDPCTGTGNFIVNLLKRIPKRDLPRVYKEQLFANEIMLLPYYIASLNIEHAYYEQTDDYEPFEGLCFVDTLDMAEHQTKFDSLTAKNSERVDRQRKTPITVIIGNPPYNADQEDENDQNRNRRYPTVDGRIRETYARASSATLKNKLYDPYVKFIRWATDRFADRPGLLCFVTNHSFVVDDRPFDGMRKHLLRDYSRVYHLDLHGNVRKNPKLSGTKHNVFGIQTGVGITIAISNGRREALGAEVYYARVPEAATKVEKYQYLSKFPSVSSIAWQQLSPTDDGIWLPAENATTFDAYMPLDGTPDRAVFAKASTGAKSNRDDTVLAFSREHLAARVEDFIAAYNAEVDRYRRKPGSQTDETFIRSANPKVQWSSGLIGKLKRGRYAEYGPERLRVCLYRPFSKLWFYYDEDLNDRPGIFRRVFPTEAQERENVALYLTSHSQQPFTPQITNIVANEAAGGRPGTCFPFYLYDEDGSNRRENITDWALAQFRSHYKDKSITKWDIFHYVYALLHHPDYRTRFADNLKRELPRIPVAPDFRTFAKVGKQLADLHLNYESLKPLDLKWVETPGVPLTYRVEKMRLSKDKSSLKVNDSLTLAGIPAEVFNYRLGNRSALEWVIDQYRVDTDPRSNIPSDPNRPDDPEYIVNLVGRICRLSLDTLRLLSSLPPLPASNP